MRAKFVCEFSLAMMVSISGCDPAERFLAPLGMTTTRSIPTLARHNRKRQIIHRVRGEQQIAKGHGNWRDGERGIVHNRRVLGYANQNNGVRAAARPIGQFTGIYEEYHGNLLREPLAKIVFACRLQDNRPAHGLQTQDSPSGRANSGIGVEQLDQVLARDVFAPVSGNHLDTRRQAVAVILLWQKRNGQGVGHAV